MWLSMAQLKVNLYFKLYFDFRCFFLSLQHLKATITLQCNPLADLAVIKQFTVQLNEKWNTYKTECQFDAVGVIRYNQFVSVFCFAVWLVLMVQWLYFINLYAHLINTCIHRRSALDSSTDLNLQLKRFLFKFLDYSTFI